MSIRKAFDILTETLGDDFKFKKDFDEFAAAVMSTQPVLKEFSKYVLSLYPNAQYVYFIVDYDPINRRNRFGEYEIVSTEKKVLATDDTLRWNNSEVHSDIFTFINDGLVPDLYVTDEDEGEEYRFNLHTLEYLGLEDYEDEKDYLARKNRR